MPERQFHAHIPLHGFRWSGESFDFAPGLRLVRRRELPALDNLLEQMGASERGDLEGISHWLEFDVAGDDPWSAGEIANVLVFAVWLAKPSRTHIAFRFLVGFGETAGESNITRLHDMMQWVKGAVADRLDDADIARAQRYFLVMMNIPKSGRLNNALVISLQASWQGKWQGAMVIFSAAAETLLTWSKSDIAHRLAATFACLPSNASDREGAYQEFRACYAGRSDVIHGRGLAIDSAERVRFVARWATIVRTIWIDVLELGTLRLALEGADVEREAYFAACVAHIARCAPSPAP